MGGLRRKFMGNHLITTQYTSSQISNEEKEQNIIEWVTFFRRNWHIYVDMILGIKLRPFQMVMIYLMGISNVFFAICSRGLSKTFIVGLGSMVKMNLYPYSEVVITSSTIAQANKMVEDKIRDEIIKKLSDYLLYMYEKEYLVITKPDDGYKIENKLNGSIMRILPCQDSSRGPRATLLVYEECRLLKKNMVDSVFEKMAHPRQAKYLANPIYGNNPRWKEECQHIYITSARYKFEWFWTLFKKTFTRHFTDRKSSCNIFAGDIFTSIANGFKTWGDYRNGLAGGEMDFRMEDLNEMMGESEDAFFTIKSFRENQILEECFRPPTVQQLYLQEDIGNKPKEENEIRLIISDFAFANTTSKEKNDNTIILFMSLHWKKNRFERHIDYLEGYPASDSLGAADRVRALIYDYDADYYILDLRNGGEVLYNYITMPKENEERGQYWNVHGLGLSPKYQILPQGKLDDLRQRTVDKTPIQCIIPVTATGESNSLMWVSLKKQLECNNIKFLVSMQDRQTLLEDTGRYYSFSSSEELAYDLLPYGQVDLLVQEAVNLKAEFKNDKVKLVEPRSSTKDRVVVLSYGNYIADLIENEWNKQNQKQDIDLSKIQLVF